MGSTIDGSDLAEGPEGGKRPFGMRIKNWMQCFIGACWALAQSGAMGGPLLAAPAATGLVRTISSGPATDLTVTDNVWLFVPASEPATPFIPPGSFKSTWTGSLVADLRADFNFHVEANGPFKLSVNEVVVVEADGKSTEPVSSKAVRLNKGANRLVAEFDRPAAGDAFVRLFWSNKEIPYTPIPNAQLQHAESPELSASLLIHEGRDLFAEFRCAKCHATSGAMPELAMDAPAFTEIGGRRRFDWMAQWIEDPARLRPGSHMPKLFSGDGAKEKAEAVAAYLASLKGPAASAPVAGDVEAGKALYEKFHCVACHVPPDAGEGEPGKISQKLVRSKFTPGSLVAFLQNPAEHYAWIRMPNFRLNREEAASLAAYLESAGEAPTERQAPTDTAVVQRGRELVESVGCLQCHSATPSKPFTTKTLADLGADAWTRGCLAETPGTDSKSPVFAFTAGQRSALRAFAATDRSSLARSTDADFLDRHSHHLQCRECHGKFEGFPNWDLLPGKLQPEWAARFIGGKESWKPRPWLEPRMPAFAAYAEHLGRGLSTIAGLPPTASPDPAPADSAELAKIGQKLAGPNGGFTCVSCHGIGDFAATQVFEAPGINLAHSGGRLQKSYFKRWLRSPLSVDPSTKMPVYFDDEGRSPLADVLEGDGPKTIGAIWEYLRLGDKMPKPE